MRRHRPRIRRWALACTGDPGRVEEVTAGVLRRLGRHLHGYDGRAAFTTWLYRVTRNAALDLARREGGGREREVSLSDFRLADGVEVETGPDPEDRLYARDVVRMVKVYFQELPPRQREVFDLADLQGYTPGEIAGMLDIHPTTVRVHLFKARRAVRRAVLERRPELKEGYGR